MKDHALLLSLIRKSEPAIRSAQLSLQNADPDAAVNRAYYAMFNISRAALLESGVPEGDLPRTHRGINEAFRQHAVLTGRIQPDVARSLSKAESLRLMADYTATEIDSDKAASIVGQAERYVREVERVFDMGRLPGLESSTAEQRPFPASSANAGESLETIREKAAAEWSKLRQIQGESQTSEKIQERARDNWLKFRQEHADRASKSGEDALGKDRAPDAGQGIGKGIEDDSDP